MGHVREIELSAILEKLPTIAPFDPLKGRRSSDLFLCGLGFEPRCCSVIQKLADAGHRVRRSVYIEYGTNTNDNSANLPELLAKLEAISDSVEVLRDSATTFGTQLRSILRDNLSQEEAALTLIVDISTFANRLVLHAMKVLLEYNIQLKVLYSEAALYRPTFEEYKTEKDKWKTGLHPVVDEGVGDVCPSMEFPGYHLDSLPDALVVFPGFNVARTKASICRVDPSLLTSPGDKVVWLLGVPHDEENNGWRLGALHEINNIPVDVPQYRVSTFDYKETLTTLEAVYQDRSLNYNVTIAPMGSKLQALGIALFCAMHPDVRVIVTVPREYKAENYSEGTRAIWEIDFGDVASTRRWLNANGTIEIIA